VIDAAKSSQQEVRGSALLAHPDKLVAKTAPIRIRTADFVQNCTLGQTVVRTKSSRETSVAAETVVSKQVSNKCRLLQFARLPHRYGNSHATWDHTVLPATRQR